MITGLTADEVAQRQADGQVNRADQDAGRSFAQIVRANTLTRFNAILGVLLLLVLSTGRLLDALFGFVLLANTVIGIAQEVRAKRTLDRLEVLHAPRCQVRRGGQVQEISIEDVVLDDVLVMRPGDQVPADGVVLESEHLECDESLLTGESDPVAKVEGDEVRSGSFVAAGSGLVRAAAVGPDSYAQQLAREASRFSLTSSGLRRDIDRILRIITWVLVAVAPVLAWSQWRASDGDWREAVVGTVAGLSGMIPEGLVLLTSLTLMVGAVRLARRDVLVQELAAVEGLSRVDVVCLDKTGTLTSGQVHLDRIEDLDGDGGDARAALLAMAALPDANATLLAIGAGVDADTAAGLDDWEVVDGVAFSSARKWSASTFAEHGTWIVGAPEIVGAALADPSVAERAGAIADTGSRVLLLARADEPSQGGHLPPDLKGVALCVLAEQVRPDAAETLAYFAQQDVTLKVISGDNPRSVAAIGAGIGLDTGQPMDARDLPDDDDELAAMVDDVHVYGRVTPQAKRRLVKALQQQGHTVAMTGDGVNDVLALKDADIGVAMGSGASATRAVAQLVLLDDRFSRMPGVVGEGRRIIHNIERVANLYLTKNVYSFVLSVSVAITAVAYPFIPRQTTIITALTYGIPSFFLALAPHQGRHEEGFLRRVLRFSIPAGAITGAAILTADVVAEGLGASGSEAQTASLIAALACGFVVLTLLARPLRPWKLALVATMAGLGVLAVELPAMQEAFQLATTGRVTVVSVAVGLVAGFGIWLVNGRTARPTAEPGVRRPSGS